MKIYKLLYELNRMLQNVKKYIYNLEAETLKGSGPSKHLRSVFKLLRQNSNAFSKKNINKVYKNADNLHIEKNLKLI